MSGHSHLPGTGRGTAARSAGVEGWKLTAGGDDRGDSAGKVLKNVACRNTQHRKTTRTQERVTLLVTLAAVIALMCDAIDLDRQAPLEAREIERQSAQRVLPAKLVAAGALAQFPPDKDFGEVARAAFALGDGEGFASGGQHPSTTSRWLAVPLPVPGRSWRVFPRLPVTARRTAARSAVVEG